MSNPNLTEEERELIAYMHRHQHDHGPVPEAFIPVLSKEQFEAALGHALDLMEFREAEKLGLIWDDLWRIDEAGKVMMNDVKWEEVREMSAEELREVYIEMRRPDRVMLSLNEMFRLTGSQS